MPHIQYTLRWVILKFLNRHKRAFVISIIVICILCIIISLDKRYKPTWVNNILGFVIIPIDGVITGAGSWIGDKVDFVIRMGEIEAENATLKEQVESLAAENSRLKLIDKENQRLSDLLEIDRKYANYPMVGANVISKDTGNWYDIFLIDKGTKDGLQKDMVVLASGGLVGRIFEAGYNYSKVRSIIDDTSGVSAESSRTEDIGTMRGDLYLMLEGKCRMEFIYAESEILQGDEIVTSHISEVYPPGIIIGHVLDVSKDPNGTKGAVIEPYVDFKHLKTVLVITKVFERELIDGVD